MNLPLTQATVAYPNLPDRRSKKSINPNWSIIPHPTAQHTCQLTRVCRDIQAYVRQTKNPALIRDRARDSLHGTNGSGSGSGLEHLKDTAVVDGPCRPVDSEHELVPISVARRNVAASHSRELGKWFQQYTMPCHQKHVTFDPIFQGHCGKQWADCLPHRLESIPALKAHRTKSNASQSLPRSPFP